MNDFYIYIYLDPRKPGQYEYGSYEFDYEPFYVGKGKDKRWKQRKNDHCERKTNKIRGLGFEPIRRRIIENIKENYSFEIEKELIKLIGREMLKEGPLTNETDGGEGISGYKWTEEQLQKRRKEYCIIKNTFKKIKYELTTEEKDYKNNKQKLEYIHNKCGREHSITWGDFQQGHCCPYCGTEECAKKLKKSFPEIKETFERRECELLTEEKDYKNCETKLEYIHNKCGRKHSITWHGFQRGQGCPYCGTEEQVKKQRKSFPEIKETFERRECKLLTKEKDYKNSKQKLEYECPKGHKHLISWNSFQKGQGCSYCGTEEQVKKQRKSFPEIKKEFERKKCKLLTKEKDYKNNKQKLEYECPKGHRHSIRWNDFQQGHKCPKCNKEKRKISKKIKK